MTAEELAEAVRSSSFAPFNWLNNSLTVDLPTVEQSRRCEQRVQLARQSEARARRQQLAVEDERRGRSEQAGAAAPALAAQRLRERRARQRLEREGDLELLIAEQASSVRAMNIARMLSPRFEEKVTFAPRVVPRSEEDQRVARLLESSTVGAFYK